MTDNSPRIALNNYMNRIGAEELNFRRWMIKEHFGHYYREVATIRVMPDGEIKCSSSEHEPTEAEAAAIKAEAPSWNMPESTPASLAATKKFISKMKWPASNVFKFHDDNGDIAMLQVRMDNEDGTKAYVPWTFWSDGQWRAMEPSGPLPFYRPEEQTSSRIMLHEGAKSAEAARQLAAEGKHPWAQELAEYEHWGMIGGALVPHRSDWDALRKRKPTELAYFCDNDHQGVDALAKVSKAYGMAMVGIEPWGTWPVGWDIADPLPEDLFTATGRYIGPKLAELRVHATWATITEDVPGSKRKIKRISPEFNKKWVHCSDPELYISLDHPSRLLTASQFDHDIAPFSDVQQTSNLLKAERSSRGVTITYDPSTKPGLARTRGGGKVINTHVPALIDPEPGDPKPFLDYIERLIPGEHDRHETLRWVATLIARPDIHMQYGLLLVSEAQGIGKTTLGEKILAPLMGDGNVSFPSEEAVVSSQFNGWVAHKRLAIVNELYAGRSSKAYDKLKSIITDGQVEINRKFVPEYTIPNWLHIFASSNSMKALKISQGDRRWLVPALTETKQNVAFWDDLNDWLKFAGGLGIIKHWAGEFVKTAGAVQPSSAAPETKRKAEVVQEGMSDMELWAVEKIEELSERYAPGEPVYFCDSHLIDAMVEELLEGRRPDYLIKPLTVRKLARAAGWHIAEGKASTNECKSRGLKTRLVCRSYELSELGAQIIPKKFPKPIKFTGVM